MQYVVIISKYYILNVPQDITLVGATTSGNIVANQLHK